MYSARTINPVLGAISQMSAPIQGVSRASQTLSRAQQSFDKGASLALKMDTLLHEEEARLENNLTRSKQLLQQSVNTAVNASFKQQQLNMQEKQFNALEKQRGITNTLAEKRLKIDNIKANSKNAITLNQAINARTNLIKAYTKTTPDGVSYIDESINKDPAYALISGVMRSYIGVKPTKSTNTSVQQQQAVVGQSGDVKQAPSAIDMPQAADINKFNENITPVQNADNQYAPETFNGTDTSAAPFVQNSAPDKLPEGPPSLVQETTAIVNSLNQQDKTYYKSLQNQLVTNPRLQQVLNQPGAFNPTGLINAGKVSNIDKKMNKFSPKGLSRIVNNDHLLDAYSIYYSDSEFASNAKEIANETFGKKPSINIGDKDVFQYLDNANNTKESINYLISAWNSNRSLSNIGDKEKAAFVRYNNAKNAKPIAAKEVKSAAGKILSVEHSGADSKVGDAARWVYSLTGANLNDPRYTSSDVSVASISEAINDQMKNELTNPNNYGVSDTYTLVYGLNKGGIIDSHLHKRNTLLRNGDDFTEMFPVVKDRLEAIPGFNKFSKNHSKQNTVNALLDVPLSYSGVKQAGSFVRHLFLPDDKKLNNLQLTMQYMKDNPDSFVSKYFDNMSKAYSAKVNYGKGNANLLKFAVNGEMQEVSMSSARKYFTTTRILGQLKDGK